MRDLFREQKGISTNRADLHILLCFLQAKPQLSESMPPRTSFIEDPDAATVGGMFRRVTSTGHTLIPP